MREELNRFFRKHPEISQAQLARVSNVNPSTISRCRNDFFHKPSQETREKIIYGMFVLTHTGTMSALIILPLLSVILAGGALLAWLLL